MARSTRSCGSVHPTRRSSTKIYHRLSLALECVRELEPHTVPLEDRASLAVVEEDLTALLEECEELLLLPRILRDERRIVSFLSRTDTVLEEAEALIRSLAKPAEAGGGFDPSSVVEL